MKSKMSHNATGKGQTSAAKKRAGNRKPAVAFQSADAALSNIRVKLSLLREYLDGRGPFVQLDGKLSFTLLPSSIRQFNSWCSRDLKSLVNDDLPEFSRNANSTLNKHAAELASIQSAVKALSSKARAEGMRPNKEASLARARDESRLQKTLREIAERELKISRQAQERLRKDAELLRTQLKSLAEEARSQNESLSQELEQLRKQNALLAKTVRKVYPLR
jgi:paraquat-inducible protein B